MTDRPGFRDDDRIRFTAEDVFQLERAADPQISPDGSRIVYSRTSFDIMTDRSRSALWIVNSDGSDHRPLITGPNNFSSARWSPSTTPPRSPTPNRSGSRSRSSVDQSGT